MKKKKIIEFGNIKIERQKFDQHKRLLLIKIQILMKIVVSNKISFGKKVSNILLAIKMLKKQTFMHVSSKTKCVQKRL